MSEVSELKVNFGISISKKVLDAVEEVRGEYSRSLAIEAMLMDYLGFPDDIQTTGYYKR